ncbi:alpha/beta hydrolase family protein [Stieleria varia]|uniref:alpha/beta hydrolase family protein n=1 Tax=Stieleria varia TaxID=2528005 RepID=UPI001E33608D|nr:alpha/beta fold hydrolase [Stieleria varia]
MKFPNGDHSVELAGIVDRPREPAHRNGQAPVVVFSHCFTCNKDLKATVRISRALAKSGITVLRFDMTGLGGSGGDFAETNFTTNLADLAAAIRFAHSELGPVTGLIGHSFGGLASLVTAAKHFAKGETQADASVHLEHLNGVITLAAPSDTSHLATLLARMNPEIESLGAGDVTIGGITWTIHRQMLEDFRQHDVTRWIPNIRCPVMLMHSPVDETVGIDHALRIMSLINSAAPNTSSSQTSKPDTNAVSLVALADADHLLVRNTDDLTYVSQTMSAFLHRYASRTPSPDVADR